MKQNHWERGRLSNAPLSFAWFFEMCNLKQKVTHLADTLVCTFQSF